MRRKVRLAAWFVLPGLVVSVLLTLPVVLRWPSGQLYYGAVSLEETWRSIADSTLYEPNPNLVNPLLYPILTAAGPYLLAAFGMLAGGGCVLLLRRRSHLLDERTRWLRTLGIVLASSCGLALAVHWLAFRFAGLLLPKERTALYVAPLLTALAGVAAAAAPSGLWAGRLRRALFASLWVLAAYFLLCLRLTYFREWQWDADVRQVYAVLSHYNHRFGICDVPSNWKFASGLNFYRVASGRETLREFEALEAYPKGAPAYVLFEPHDGAFIQAQGLEVAYRGWSGVVVAVRPSTLAPPGTGREGDAESGCAGSAFSRETQ